VAQGDGDLRARKSSLTDKIILIDTTTSTGRLVFHIFAALAEFERELIAERAAVGRAAARARGRLGGRGPPNCPGEREACPVGGACARATSGGSSSIPDLLDPCVPVSWSAG